MAHSYGGIPPFLHALEQEGQSSTQAQTLEKNLEELRKGFQEGDPLEASEPRLSQPIVRLCWKVIVIKICVMAHPQPPPNPGPPQLPSLKNRLDFEGSRGSWDQKWAGSEQKRQLGPGRQTERLVLTKLVPPLH